MSRADDSGFGGATRDLAVLRLLQLFDSQFPIGAFAHSGGIETYAAQGGGLAELRQVLGAQIDLGWGRSDLAASHLAWKAAGPETGTLTVSRTETVPASRALEDLSVRLDALKVVPAVREASIRLGRRTLALLRRLYPEIPLDLPRPHHAVVIGAAARHLGVDARDLLLAYAQSLAMGTLAAAVRCMPVSPEQAQALLVESHPRIVEAVERACDDPDGSMFTSAPALDIRSHQQAGLHTRLFQS
ncbi:MAG TPA: urease accessory UreF family protein [Vicinamibacterales bacterium]|nr:urease accessory UreF family protein [Vicinamibacterales bacterium]